MKVLKEVSQNRVKIFNTPFHNDRNIERARTHWPPRPDSMLMTESGKKKGGGGKLSE